MNNKIKNVTINFFLVIFGFIICIPINCFSYEFIDEFEYYDSPTNHGWDFNFSGNDSFIFTSKESFSKGGRSLKSFIDNEEAVRVGINYNFSNNEFGDPINNNDTIELSLNFYDQYEKESFIEKHFRKYIYDKNGYVKKYLRSIYSNKTDDCARFTIDLYFSETPTYVNHITISWSGIKYSFWMGRKWNYIKSREKGWHQVKIRIENSQLSFYFDNELVAPNIYNIFKLNKFYWNSNIIAPHVKGYSWIDNVKFIRINK